jgi:hypothetical protein
VIEELVVDRSGEFRRALGLLYRDKGLAAGLRREARLVAVNMAFQTQPFGGSKAMTTGGTSGKEQGEGAVARDIRKVIKTPSDVHHEIEMQSLSAAKGFSYLMKNGRYLEAEQMLNRLNIPKLMQAKVGPMNATIHQAARKPIPARPRISKTQKPLLITSQINELKAYVKEVQKKVGIAKAGWASCAQQLGGTGGRMAAAGGQQQAVPAWVKRHVGKRASGTVVDQADKIINGRVLLINHVPWVSKCLTDTEAQRALDIQREKMLRRLGYVLEAEALKAGF